jgi:hypothetical protein
MIKYLIIIIALSLTACSTTVPVTAKFPSAPLLLLEQCPQLKTISSDTATLSIMTKTVVDNYTTYYECAVKNDAWIEWYQTQKIIFEKVSK